ncbi:cholinesterase-like isoform X1 [Schistocerca nitens]|uniref:cholinesterase-like isoform X1 n=1 Tax=Schistocerca nitens TaxID=7011 RepID=UPI0021189FD1|nr:cholinesterase-like isoform X1 [Schistocerca nitens]
MRSSQLAFVPSLLLWLAAAVKAEDVLVAVQQGTLQGKTATGVYNTSYTAFLGIPYAVPPLGELRFKAPQPAERWEGVLNATEYGSDCVQEDGSGSEDCLYLNVFVPGVPQEGAGLPVLFWVHGGGFVRGSGSDYDYGPDFLISYDVIFVTINYRLGPLGFFSTGDEVVPGNAGLKDQQLALAWVQSNIARFGGDPQRVMLFGQSAGGGAVSLHLVSPTSAGLFSRLVDQSGSYIARMTVVQEPSYHAFRLGAVLGYETEDSQQLVEFLQSVNATDLLVDQNLLKSDEQKLLLAYMVWAPTVEPDLDGAFITESPIRALNEGRFNQVPIMTGVTSAENGGGILSNADLINNLNEAFEEAVGPCLHLPTTEEQREAAIKLRNFYFGDANITAENPAPLVYMNEDLTFFEPADAMVRKIAEITDLPVYYYEFDYRGENVPVSEWGVAHAGELQFLFMRNGVDVDYNLDPDSEEEHVRRNMLRLWTNFGKYGNPTPEADPVIWQPYDLTNRSYLLMQANFTLEENRLAERMDFWNQNVPLLPYPGTF